HGFRLSAPVHRDPSHLCFQAGGAGARPSPPATRVPIASLCRTCAGYGPFRTRAGGGGAGCGRRAGGDGLLPGAASHLLRRPAAGPVRPSIGGARRTLFPHRLRSDAGFAPLESSYGAVPEHPAPAPSVPAQAVGALSGASWHGARARARPRKARACSRIENCPTMAVRASGGVG